MKPNKNKWLLFAIGLMLLLTISTGCKSSSVQKEGEPILVGAPIPVTGPFAADGEVMNSGIQMAIDDINAKGGLLGRKLKIDIFDIGDMTPEKLMSAADKLVMRDKVAVNVTGYAGMGPDIPAFGKYPPPYIHFDGSQTTIDMVQKNKYSNIFMLGDVEKPYGELTFDIITKKLPYKLTNKKIAILTGDFEWDKKVTEGIKERAIESGWDVVMYEIFPYGTREWGPLLTKIRSIDPAIISFSDLDPADAKTFLEQFQTKPTKSIIDMGYVITVPDFANIVGSAGNGVLGIATNSVIPGPKGDEWEKRFKEKFNKEPGLSIGGTVYDGVMIWAEAVKKVGKVDDYKAVQKAIKENTYEGVIGKFTFDQDNKVPTSNDTLPMHFFQVKNGKPVLLYCGTDKKGEFLTPTWLN